MSKQLIKKVPPYIDSPKCLVCQAEDLKGNRLRDDIDAKVVANFSLQQIIGWCKQSGFLTTKQQLAYHLKNHSSYVLRSKQELSRKQQVLQKNLEVDKTEANNALDRIINIGDKMVDNFYKQQFQGEETTGPVMEVDARLYTEALKEQGRRGSLTKLDEAFEALEKRRFSAQAVEGEVVEEIKLNEKATSGK